MEGLGYPSWDDRWLSERCTRALHCMWLEVCHNDDDADDVGSVESLFILNLK